MMADARRHCDRRAVRFGQGHHRPAGRGALGFHFLDSGALYRLVASGRARAGVTWTIRAQVAAIAHGLDVGFAQGEIVLRGSDVTDAIRTEEAGVAASQVAALPRGATALLGASALRRPPGLVADGRDMGSVVFPDARPQNLPHRRCRRAGATGAISS